MKLLLSMPGGAEWILVILFFCFSLIIPICAIYYYLKSKSLMKELQRVTREKDLLLAKILEKSG